MGIRNSDLDYDPVSVNDLYLITEARELWEMNSETGDWKRVRTGPTRAGHSENTAMSCQPRLTNLGDVLWHHQRTPLLYRHSSSE